MADTSINLDNCSLGIEEVNSAILGIPGTERFGNLTGITKAFKLANGGIVLLVMLPGFKRLFVNCAPEELNDVAVAIVQQLHPAVIQGTTHQP
jgi:hypothetical protein